MHNFLKTTFQVTALFLLSLQFASAQETKLQSPGLGEPISEQDLAPWNIGIEADGSGLPPGSGTVQQGEVLYQAQCVACHGEKGVGGQHDRLAGGFGTLNTNNPVKTIGSFWPTATTVFDYVRRAMPFNTPHTLTNDEAYALTAYLLFINGIIKENDVLDAPSLKHIEMPNADGFIMAYPNKNN